MHAFPQVVRPKAPPIKTQGIKTKLVPFILRSFEWDGKGRWIEPFVGSGAVVFNAAPKRALVADSNKHVIGFYTAVQKGELTPTDARTYLEEQGAFLEKHGKDHYYAVRTRFNQSGSPLDFLFLSRACFNGVMRFNGKGAFNVPYCKKDNRFRPAYVTKICNQIDWIAKVIRRGDWIFVCQDWRTTLRQATSSDFLYVDPPYIGRHTDYYNSWDDTAADELAETLKTAPCGFAYSMWSKNRYRENEHLKRHFANYAILTQKHFYHVGSSEDLRNEMEEALVVSPHQAVRSQTGHATESTSQLSLLL